ncbi:NAD(P)H-dependent oxidoreductase [Brevundimonas sp. SL130]|uniref:NAD(P)H-dependent oxidoreductase n=1 Tax=Brevundimonas sp. SL130 TaxID=2995143 RepID=UPI00226C75AA|nr:NAD(P)H-dependent oxidoreductase [Brevundimonas sp. SL130]WAC59067.1 NAD(P)H-dependent oxidoreductase [Brevundimonas sp. SL130]
MTQTVKPFTAAILLAHPRAESFTGAMASGFADAFTAAGGQAVVRDLYRIPFDPVLHAEEIPDHPGFKPRPDVVEERRLIGRADVFVLFYPLWFNATPAILKGYVDRVFGMGFAYSSIHAGGNQPLLKGRKLLSFTSSGAPQAWVETSGAWTAMNKHFDEHLAGVAGLDLIGHHNTGGVTPGMSADVVAARRAAVADIGWRLAQAHGVEAS